MAIREAELRATSSQPASWPELTIIVPTRNEAGNVEALLGRVQEAVAGRRTEVIFVDDSTDDTPQVISSLAGQFAMPVSLIHRPAGQRGDGLGGAVAAGMRAATGQWLCVMDADLQHPPSVIPQLLARARDSEADLVLASRFVTSGRTDGLTPARLITSQVFRRASQVLFPGRLASVTDPMTGFFLVRRDAIDPNALRPKGFKILLEILVRFPDLKVAEVPFQFDRRHAGESKANPREVLRYLSLLMDLRFGKDWARMVRFGLVGISGILVNQLLLALFTEFLSVFYVVSAVIATQGSSLWNFGLTDAWVFRGRPNDRPLLVRLGAMLLVNNALLLLRGPLLVVLTEVLGSHYLISNFITLVVFTAARYMVADRFIWSESGAGTKTRLFNYDIHGIVRVTSEVRLPELAYFRTPDAIEAPDLTVRMGGLWGQKTGPATASGTATASSFHYAESVGRFGFWVDVTRGERTDVIAGPLLRFSPHVLYTNVVEPILRWMVVTKGHALMHAACLSTPNGAFLITAHTDTGKTTTILRVLARHALQFLSDDMVLLKADGALLCYPKPLTISRHTLEAVSDEADLTFWERLALVLQSRVHSKSGRLFAKLLAAMPVLPVATINTLVQMIVPPPKYFIERLVPGTVVRQQSMVKQRFEIERGENAEMLLDPVRAEELALEDCEDAYGFPPYREIEPFLTTWDGRDLRPVERQIISSALAACPTLLLRREVRDWWARVIDVAVAQPSWQPPIAEYEAELAPESAALPEKAISWGGD